jgi:hypothetical protein
VPVKIFNGNGLTKFFPKSGILFRFLSKYTPNENPMMTRSHFFAATKNDYPWSLSFDRCHLQLTFTRNTKECINNNNIGFQKSCQVNLTENGLKSQKIVILTMLDSR